MPRAVIAAVCLFMCVQAHPQRYPPIKDGNSLLANCSAVEKSPEDMNMSQFRAGTACMNYIDGVSNGFALGAAMGNTSKSSLLCIPDEVTSLQGALVVLTFLKNHPEELHLPPANLVYEALHKAFPCK